MDPILPVRGDKRQSGQPGKTVPGIPWAGFDTHLAVGFPRRQGRMRTAGWSVSYAIQASFPLSEVMSDPFTDPRYPP